MKLLKNFKKTVLPIPGHKDYAEEYMNMITIFTLTWIYFKRFLLFIQWSERFIDYNHSGIDFPSLFREIFYLEYTYEKN